VGLLVLLVPLARGCRGRRCIDESASRCLFPQIMYIDLTHGWPKVEVEGLKSGGFTPSMGSRARTGRNGHAESRGRPSVGKERQAVLRWSLPEISGANHSVRLTVCRGDNRLLSMGASQIPTSATERIAEAMKRSVAYLPQTLAAEGQSLLSNENLTILAGTIAIWAGSHFFGLGEIVDVGLLFIGAFTLGRSIADVGEQLLEFATTAIRARSDEDLDRSARAFAAAVMTGGIDAVSAILLHRTARGLQSVRGANLSEVAARRFEAGLVEVGEDSQAGAAWRQHTAQPDRKLAAGMGSTTPFGDVTYSPYGSARDQALARAHEAVHSALSPRLRPLRRFRVRLASSAYVRSPLMKYLEEALAESFAQVSVNGIRSVLAGVRFPVANGYVTLQELATEGSAIGTITVGAQRFSVQFVPGSPGRGGN